MTTKDLSQLRRRFRPDKSNLTFLHGCYVSQSGELLDRIEQTLSQCSDEERELILAQLKKTISGRLGRQLSPLSFDSKEVQESPEHALLMRLRNHKLRDPEALELFYEKVASSVSLDSPYVILLVSESYDLPYRAKDGSALHDAGNESHSYLLCAICPLALPKPSLCLSPGTISRNAAELQIKAPELGFLFPALEDGSPDLYTTLYYTKNLEENHATFAQTLFGQSLPLPADVQKEAFGLLLAESLGDACSLDGIAALGEELQRYIEEQKEDEHALIGKAELLGLLKAAGFAGDIPTRFSTAYDESLGAETKLSPQNLLDLQQITLKAEQFTVRLSGENSRMLETRRMGGIHYILIRADDGVLANGIPLHID